MKFTVVSPSKAVIEASEAEKSQLIKDLTFTNTSVAHEVKRHYNNFWARQKNEEQWAANLELLKAKAKRTLVYEEDGQDCVRPGSIPYIVDEKTIVNQVTYKTPKKVPWKKPLPFELHPYQQESFERLLAAKHGNVELCTGSGKTAILLKMCRETGFRAAIVAPSKSIFFELVASFEKYLGRGSVGAFGAGRKSLGKNFTICIDDSLVNVKPGTKEWDFFSKLDMLCVDESHTWGADTLESICFGVMANVPYRFFFSGTQTRGNGTEKLLQSIIGETVYTLSTEEAVRGGYISPHEYRIVDIESSNPNYNTSDALDMKRNHFLKNRNICAFVAKLANIEATNSKRQTLVLVEELEQIAMLVPLLKVPFAIAHSEKKPDRLATLGLEKVDTAESVEQFNKGEAMVLIGTSCIATGTNIYPTHNTVNWVGGASEIKTKQGAIGRSVRMQSQNPWPNKNADKTKAIVWDFNVHDVFIMKKHLEVRLAYYQDSGSEIRTIRLKQTTSL